MLVSDGAASRGVSHCLLLSRRVYWAGYEEQLRGPRTHLCDGWSIFLFFFRPKFWNLLQNLLPRINDSSVHYPVVEAAAADSVITTFGLGVEIECADAGQDF